MFEFFVEFDFFFVVCMWWRVFVGFASKADFSVFWSVETDVPGVASALYYGGGAPINPAMATVGDTIPSRDKSFDQFQPKISLTTSIIESKIRKFKLKVSRFFFVNWLIPDLIP